MDKLLRLLTVSLALVAGLSFAGVPKVARAQDPAAVAQSQDWRDLLHFRPENSESDILPGPFFLHPRGHQDPSAELVATLDALRAPVPENASEHALCRYPARVAFLEEAGLWDSAAPITCPIFDDWSDNETFTSASLIFAFGDFGRPGSFFGHLLMRFGSDDTTALADDIFAKSLNFGALSSPDDSAFSYIGRGLFGGYTSAYSHTEFFSHQHGYSDNEQRVIWIYQLDLSQDQVDFLVRHSWELRDARWRYFFIGQNCAFEFAHLLELTLDQPVLPPNKPWSTPFDVFDRLSEMTHPDGRPVIRQVEKVAPPQAIFRNAFAELTVEEQRAVRRLINTGEALPRSLSEASRLRALETALLYVGFAETGVDEGSEEAAQIAALKRALTLERLGLPPGASVSLTGGDAADAPPHEGHKSSTVQVGVVDNSTLGTGLLLTFRPALSDYLSLTPGALPFSELRGFDTEVFITEDRVSLRRFEVISLGSLNPSPTRVGADRAAAVSARLGYEQRRLGCDDCGVGYLAGSYGISALITDTNAAAALLQGRVATDLGDEFELGLGPQFVLNGRFANDAVAYLATAGVSFDLANDSEALEQYALTLRVGGAQDWDIRLNAKAEREIGDWVTELGLSASLHF